jgi:WD40 repeat protein
MQTLDAYKGKVRCLSFSADGTTLASGGGTGQTPSLWNLASGKRSRLPGRPGGPRTLAFAPSGTALAVRFWAQVVLWRAFVPSAHTGSAFAFRGDGAVLAIQETAHFARTAEVRFVNVAGNEPAGTPVALQHWGGDLAWSPAGPVLAMISVLSSSLHISLIRPEESPVLSKPLALPGSTSNLTFSPDGRTLAVASTKVILRWDVETASVLPALKGHDRMVNSIGYLPDGRLLSASNDGTVRTWLEGKCVDVKDWQIGELTALAVARDGMRAAVGNKSGTILIWDID